MSGQDTGPIRSRSTTDLLILMIAGTICFAVLAAGGTIAVIEITNNGQDTSTAYKSVQDVINTLIGLLAGFLAGRTESSAMSRREYRQTKRDLEADQAEDEET